jgi:hypothetical protein
VQHLRHAECAEDEADDEGVEDCNRRSLGRGEDSAEDSPDDHHRHQDGDQGIPNRQGKVSAHENLIRLEGWRDEAALLEQDVVDDHDGHPDQDARDDSRNEEIADRCLALYPVDDKRDAGRDHSAHQRGGSDGGHRELAFVPILLHLGNHRDAHSGEVRRGGTAHPAEEHRDEHGDLGKPPVDLAQ